MGRRRVRLGEGGGRRGEGVKSVVVWEGEVELRGNGFGKKGRGESRS